ncbi:MAG: S-layer homology domain-containing protein, partial [Clostridia bacterium]
MLSLLLLPSVADAQQGKRPFSDIENHPAERAIISGYQNGLFYGGKGTAKFEPDRYMTRSEFLLLIDRVYLQNEQQLFPLLLLSEHDELGLGEGFEEPHLPYLDVDRMTAIYQPILRMEIAFNKMFGPNALEQVFPGTYFLPNQPISKKEASQLLSFFDSTADGKVQAAEIQPSAWLAEEKTDKVKRGEAAVLAQKLLSYLEAEPILPLLDPGETKYPLVPEIKEIFPLFGTFTDQPNADEANYLDAVEQIRSYEEDGNQFDVLQKLVASNFYNQIGLHYYLSWNPHVSLQENMEEGFAAIDAYFADKVVQPQTLQLLAANVYDLALKLESEDPKIYEKTFTRLRTYESKMKPLSEEWQTVAIYVGAMEAKSGRVQDAIDLYSKFVQNDQALLNGVYYLISLGKLDEAQQLLQTSAETVSGKNQRHATLVASIRQELAILKEQPSYINDLSFALRHTENAENYTIKGESTLNGYAFKYEQAFDREQRFSRASGYFQAPDSLVLQKLETFHDAR